ncbi:MAG: hypothetical protein ACI8RD_014543, partial [Bacillariaceae sp.]
DLPFFFHKDCRLKTRFSKRNTKNKKHIKK